jgi:hypothetical protein
MTRPWKSHEFDSLYERYICQEEMQFGGAAYHRRYRSRYKECLQRFAALAPPHPVDVLDVGGGQLALMCTKLWGDHGVVADLPGPHLSYMAGKVWKQFSGTCAKLSRLLSPDSTSSFFLKSSSIYRYRVTSCWNVSGRSCGLAVSSSAPRRISTASETWCLWHLGSASLTIFNIPMRMLLSAMCLNIVAIISIGR